MSPSAKPTPAPTCHESSSQAPPSRQSPAISPLNESPAYLTSAAAPRSLVIAAIQHLPRQPPRSSDPKPSSNATAVCYLDPRIYQHCLFRGRCRHRQHRSRYCQANRPCRHQASIPESWPTSPRLHQRKHYRSHSWHSSCLIRRIPISPMALNDHPRADFTHGRVSFSDDLQAGLGMDIISSSSPASKS